MDRTLRERRLHARFRAPVVDGIRAVLRPGHVVSLVDLGSGGALIHGSRPLRPGARVHLQLEIANRRYGIAAEILRCTVASLDAIHGAQYRGALRFDTRCNVWEEASAGAERLASPAG